MGRIIVASEGTIQGTTLKLPITGYLTTSVTLIESMLYFWIQTLRQGKEVMGKIIIIIAISSSILLAVSNKSQKESKIDEQLKKQMEKEQKYAKEQTFYHGDEYDLESYEVDPDSLADVPSIEPDYDFDMSTGVYSD